MMQNAFHFTHHWKVHKKRRIIHPLKWAVFKQSNLLEWSMARSFVERSHFEMNVQRQHLNHWIRISFSFSFSLNFLENVCLYNAHLSQCSLFMSLKFPLRHCFCACECFFFITDLKCDGHLLCRINQIDHIVRRRKPKKLIWALIRHKLSIYFLPFGPRTTTIQHVWS